MKITTACHHNQHHLDTAHCDVLFGSYVTSHDENTTSGFNTLGEQRSARDE
jgi:hypothetical protein